MSLDARRAHKIIGIIVVAHMIVKNQNIDRQPRVPANTPPSNGPTAH